LHSAGIPGKPRVLGSLPEGTFVSSVAFSFQAVPPAPPRPQGPGQAAPAAPAAQQGAPQQGAPAEGGGPPPEAPGAFGVMLPLLLLVPLLLLMFFSTRSQQKKQAQAIAQLKKGDRVITQSGLVGKLLEVGDRYAKLELAPGVKVEILKSGLLGKDNPETAAAAEKK
jgi:preprotein translocase subunit YajC